MAQAIQPPLGVAWSSVQHCDPQHSLTDQEGGQYAGDYHGDAPRPEKDWPQVMVNLQTLNQTHRKYNVSFQSRGSGPWEERRAQISSHINR